MPHIDGVGFSAILHSRSRLLKPSEGCLHTFDAVTVLRDTSLLGFVGPETWTRVLPRPMSVFGPLSRIVEAGLDELSDDESDPYFRRFR